MRSVGDARLASARVREFYEDLWRRLPPDLAPPELGRRALHLRAHVRAGARVLDLGCGDGAFAEIIADAKWVGADIAQEAIGRARRRHPGLRWERIDEDAPLPFADESFAAVWCSETLEHVGDTAGFLAEARRVLAREAPLVLTVPDHPRVRTSVRTLARGVESWAPPLGDHLRFYCARSLRDVLADAGLERIAVRRSGPLLLAVARRPS